jgi:glycosyltransferase involved in cell wall biosynthesis
MNTCFKVIYISGVRGVETPLLEYLATQDPRFSFVAFKLHLRSMSLKLYLKTLCEVLKKIRQYKPHVLLLEQPGIANIALILVTYAYKLPLAIRIKGDLWAGYSEIDVSIRSRERIKKFLNFTAASLIIKSANLIIPISKILEKKIRDKTGNRANIKTVYIPHKIYLCDPLVQVQYENRKEYILTVTNFNFWTKIEPLANTVKTFASLLKKRGLVWVILGDGFFLKRFSSSIREQIDQGTVQLLGSRNPAPFYREAKALFYISGMDGLPNVILEASMQYLPVFMNDDCPAIEFVKHGVNGIVVNFRDPSQVAGALDVVQKDEIEMRRLAASAYTYVTQTFSLSKVSADLLTALRQCVMSKDFTKIV